MSFKRRFYVAVTCLALVVPSAVHAMDYPTDYIRDSISDGARRGRVFLSQNPETGRYTVPSEVGPMEFNGRIFARNNDNQVVELGGLQDVPFGTNVLLTDNELTPISYGTMSGDGHVRLHGATPTNKGALTNALSTGAAKTAQSLAGAGGVVADILGQEELSTKFLDYAEETGRRIEAGQAQHNPAAYFAQQAGTGGNVQKIGNLVGRLAPFLLLFAILWGIWRSVIWFVSLFRRDG